MPWFGHSHMDDFMFLAELEFEIHDFHQVVVGPLSKALQDIGANITSVPDLGFAVSEVVAVHLENRGGLAVGRTVMFHRKARELRQLGGQS